MKTKILLLMSLAVVLLLVVSCAPKMTDEELEAELSKLSPEELEEVTAEDSALAGKARTKLTDPNLIKLRNAYRRTPTKCDDSDKVVPPSYPNSQNGENYFVKGTATFSGGTGMDRCVDGKGNTIPEGTLIEEHSCTSIPTGKHVDFVNDCTKVGKTLGELYFPGTTNWKCVDGACVGERNKDTPATTNGDTPATTVTHQLPTCGDGDPQAPEECDDGIKTDTYYPVNALDDDGICVIDSTKPANSCKRAVCGDGYLFVGGPEQCDDGNNVNLDGCNSDCKNEDKEETPAATGQNPIAPTGLTGWAAGSSGILHTIDGGNTWSKQTSTGVIKVQFLDKDVGWAVAADGTTLRSYDGGATWTKVHQGAKDSSGYFLTPFQDFHAIDNDKAWAVGRDKSSGTYKAGIFYTADGGTTWEPKPAPSLNSKTDYVVYRLFFLDVNRAWATTVAGGVLLTTDGGATWSSKNVDANCCKNIFFTDAANGWANTGLDLSGSEHLFRSNDGGMTWTKIYSTPTSSFVTERIVFWGASKGLLVGSGPEPIPGFIHGKVLHTTDGGSSFSSPVVWPATESYSGKDVRLYDADFTDQNNGWAVGQPGIILHTADGGNTWTQQLVPSGSLNLKDVYFLK
ncbi:MAG TPA: YCF48-related protein [Candidatus Nanoarchaeia archaeon]|nr:YCF48-related protein [Candidatus Nanoarchaeia archaeon]